MDFIQEAQLACEHAIKATTRLPLKFRPMRRKDNHVNTKRGFVIGRTNLRTGLITIDIYTPKTRREKKMSSILRTLAHEVAHHQRKPYREHYKGRWIIRQHFPRFYDKVNKNIAKIKKDPVLSRYFV